MANLEDFLDTSCHLVVLAPDDVGVHDTGCAVQGIDSRVDPQLCDPTGQYGGGVKMRKGGGRGGICQVISWHVDSLV